MDMTQGLIDLLRAAHLVLFAAGMGTALYFDFRTFQTFYAPIEPIEIETLDRFHRWITMSFAGLWITGIALIYVRTAFDVSAFSPKLWLKIALMSVMLINSFFVAKVVIPTMRANVGIALNDIPRKTLILTTQIAIVSLFCWSSGLMLGSSVVLKTAPWDILLPLTLAWALLLTIGGQLCILILRKEDKLLTQS